MNGRIPPAFKWVYLAVVLVIVPVYAVEHGWLNFLWFSNLALLGGLVAVWLENRRIASMMLVAVLLPELVWVLDFVASIVVWGSAPLGIVQYLFDPGERLFVRLLSLYHVPLPFVLLWLVARLGYDPRAWQFTLLFGWGVLLLTFSFATPEKNVNWILGPWGEVQQWVPAWAWLGGVMAFLALVWVMTHLLARYLFLRHRGPGAAKR